MNTAIEPITGTVAAIVAEAARPGEDWGLTKAPRTEYAPATIPAREPRTIWQVGDVYIDGRNRWMIRRIDGDTVTLTSSSIVEAAITWTTTLDNLTPRSAA